LTRPRDKFLGHDSAQRLDVERLAVCEILDNGGECAGQPAMFWQRHATRQASPVDIFPSQSVRRTRLVKETARLFDLTKDNSPN